MTTKRSEPSARLKSRSAPKRGGSSKPGSNRPQKSAKNSARRHVTQGDLEPEADARGLFSERNADVLAIGLVAVGILLALAMYGLGAGSLGRDVDGILADAIGWIRFILPVGSVGAGVMVIVRRYRPDPTRVVFGALLGLVSLAGLATLAAGIGGVTTKSSRLRVGGGWAGFVVAKPLEMGLGTAGAVVVLAAIAAIAVVISTGVSLRSCATGASKAVSGSARWIKSSWERAQRSDRSSSSTESTSAPHLFDQELLGTGGDLKDRVISSDTPSPKESGSSPDPLADVDETSVTDSTGGLGGESSGSDELVDIHRAIGSRPLDPAAGEREWRLPPISLLRRSAERPHDAGEIDGAGEALVRALGTHGVETKLVGWTAGPTVTRFELELGAGVKVSRVTSLSKDIAYAMASPDVRILAPIPGKSAIGVEVPNQTRQLVSLGDILVSSEAAEASHPLEVALGRGISGKPVMMNLSQMPHVLISGATGAGKSSCINSLITTILMRATPEEVRLILVDPKRVELSQYNGLPHLLTAVVVDPKQAANALSWAVKEMERRYDLLAKYGVRDITGFNEGVDRGDIVAPESQSIKARAEAVARSASKKAQSATADSIVSTTVGAAEIERSEGDSNEDRPSSLDPPTEVVDVELDVDGESAGEPGEAEEEEGAAEIKKLPFILVIVDELNDLMMVAARDVEESVVRIAQMARAVGIHLVIATQRPSVDVITGVIKANIPSRMAFSVSSLADSRVILDQPGAERLIGKGDMLVMTASSSIPRRLQAPWVSEEEVRSVVAYWKRQGGTSEEAVGISSAYDSREELENGGDDELLAAAMDLVVKAQIGSTSMLQRKLRVGFARAGRIMDLLERKGVVGPAQGSKARAVLMTQEELESLVKSD